ncbi:hypothetical protein X971_3464 [Agrobacterium tumefaciens LBA4213 (Ach5)]|nr:hypothetical protein X971_3464 [Agrobacterium tumefaciens LBA4213 (Ach5)]
MYIVRRQQTEEKISEVAISCVRDEITSLPEGDRASVLFREARR